MVENRLEISGSGGSKASDEREVLDSIIRDDYIRANDSARGNNIPKEGWDGIDKSIDKQFSSDTPLTLAEIDAIASKKLDKNTGEYGLKFDPRLQAIEESIVALHETNGVINELLKAIEDAKKKKPDAGQDEKIIAVPSTELTKRHDHIREYSDIPKITLQQIEHFFEHYKDLEPGKWVKIGNWHGAEDARRLIVEAIERAKDA